MRILILFLVVFYCSFPARAACTSPAGEVGAREYFTGAKAYKYCDGSDWLYFTTDGSDGTCSTEAAVEFDNPDSQFKACNGSDWYNMGALDLRQGLLTNGRAFGCAMKTDNAIVCWGNYDPFGDPGPSVTGAPAGTNFIAMSGGNTGTDNCAVKTDNSIVCWGGSSGDPFSDTPTTSDFKAVSLSGFDSACALKTDNSLTCWGNTYKNQHIPPSGNDFAVFNGGYVHYCALKTDGSLACWGNDDDGQSSPPAGNDYIAVSAGGRFSCALKTDGSLVCWGKDGASQITDTPAGTNFIAVTAGFDHACALKTDHSLACWGNGQSGPPGGTDFIMIDAGRDHTCALKADNSLACWGDNSRSWFSDMPTGNNFGSAGAAALSACTTAGLVEWDSGLALYKYCDGTDWYAMND